MRAWLDARRHPVWHRVGRWLDNLFKILVLLTMVLYARERADRINATNRATCALIDAVPPHVLDRIDDARRTFKCGEFTPPGAPTPTTTHTPAASTPRASTSTVTRSVIIIRPHSTANAAAPDTRAAPSPAPAAPRSRSASHTSPAHSSATPRPPIAPTATPSPSPSDILCASLLSRSICIGVS